jgi:hypothetical protein
MSKNIKGGLAACAYLACLVLLWPLLTAAFGLYAVFCMAAAFIGAAVSALVALGLGLMVVISWARQ